MVPREREHFLSMETEFLLGISISVCLRHVVYGLLAGYASGWTHLCQLVRKDKKQNKGGSSHGCVLPVTLLSLAPNKSPGCNMAQLHSLGPDS